MTQKEAPDGFIQKEEGAVISKLHGTILKIEDLNEDEVNEIKLMASKYNACIVYIDINDLFQFKSKTAGLSDNQLYYYWVHSSE